MKLPRWYHRMRTDFLGGGWMVCPGCGGEFGGHEQLHREEDRGGHVATAMVLGATKPICPECTRRGVGCKSHYRWNRPHSGCPYLAGLEPGDVPESISGGP